MVKTRGNLTKKIDRNLLHEYLWENRGRNDIMGFSQKELSEKLDVSQFTVSHIFAEMRETGRVRRIGSKYQIIDPKIYNWKKSSSDSLF